MFITKWMAALALIAVPAFAESPNPSEIFIEKVMYNGTGCRPGSVASQLSGDAQAFTLLFDDYIVDTSKKGKPDPDSSPEPMPAQKACNIVLDMHVPPGWSFALFSVDVRGFAHLRKKAQGFQRTAYYFNGNEKEIDRYEMKGPVEQDYFHRMTTPVDQLEFSSCEGKVRNLKIRTSIRVQGRGMLTVDSTDGELKQKYGMVWKKCAQQPAPKPKPKPHRP